MTDLEEKQLMERVVDEHRRGEQVEIVLDSPVAYAVVAGLQLSLRHPRNNGPTAQMCTAVIYGIIEQFRELGLEATAQAAELGNDPALDRISEIRH